MIDPANVPDVDSEEPLARFILQSGHIRTSSRTLKPDAFMPHPYHELSVTRHLQATEDEIWSVGKDVANANGKTMHGRGDIRAAVCLAQQLRVNADPIPDNPNHALVVDWPADKPAQKIIALEIAATAVFVAKQ
jgi:hypothetical protein